MPTPTPAQLDLIDLLTQRDSFDRYMREAHASLGIGYHGLAYSFQLARLMREKTGAQIGHMKVIEALIKALEDAKLDLTDCRNEYELHTHLLAYLAAGRGVMEGRG